MRPLLAFLAPLLLALPTAARSPAKTDFSAIDARMQSLVARYRLDGASLWVSHNGQPVLIRYYGGYSEATRIPIASASKWVSALVLARLVERGTLRWDSTVGEWWPTAPADKRAITLAQLFSHTSGLPGDESGCIANALTTLQACAGQILAGPMIAAPGSTFAYGGLSMQVAGAMAERATGLGWDTLFARELTTPLALTATDFGLNSSAPGIVTLPNPRIAGGVRSTLSDYRKLMAMWQADGIIREGPNAGQRYLAVSTIRAMQRDHAAGTAKVDVPNVPQSIGNWGYGFGYWLLPTTRAGAPVVESSPGAFGFQGWVDGAAGIAGVFMVQDTNARMAPEAAAVQADLARLLDPPRFTQSPQPTRARPLSQAK
jgi:CubicO group peptidase (beta-lactamase class C family)